MFLLALCICVVNPIIISKGITEQIWLPLVAFISLMSPLRSKQLTAPFDSIKPIPNPIISSPNMFSEQPIMERNDSLTPTTCTEDYISTKQTKYHQCNVGMTAESLSMCTEGLGIESFYDVECLKNEEDMINDHHECFDTTTKHVVSEIESKRSRIKGVEFPPPISSLGLSGKPWVSLESYRSNGRFILREVRMPTQELLQACREDGRLKLQFIQSHDEGLYEDEEENEEVKDQTN